MKARIVAESLLPGARVCNVAQKYGLIAHHVSQWRGLARKGELVLPDHDGPAFVPLMLEPMALHRPVVATSEAGVVRIEIGGAVLDVASDCSPECAAALAATL